jgi:ribosomal protein L16/L10AE
MNLRFKKNFKPKLIKNLNNVRFSNLLINPLQFGTFGLLATKYQIITYKQINSIRLKVSKYLKKIKNIKFKIYVRIFFILSFTQKPKLTRMGKGSGPIKR